VVDAGGPEEILTSTVTVYEVYKRAKAIRGEHAALENVAALRQALIVPMDPEIAPATTDFSLAPGLYFVDALIYATAGRHSAMLTRASQP